jgi:hypothetical protein
MFPPLLLGSTAALLGTQGGQGFASVVHPQTHTFPKPVPCIPGSSYFPDVLLGTVSLFYFTFSVSKAIPSSLLQQTTYY